MFTRQAPPLVTNLWQAGLSPAQASAIQNIFGQCRQALTHNGPVQYDYTRKDMRLIGPADATFKYPGVLFPSPENFPREPSTPDPLPLPPRPGSPPRNPSKEPDPRKVPGKGNKPGGHFPPDHLPVDPQMPDGPGEEPKFPGQPWGPNAFNGLWFAGEYINIDLPNRRIGLENNDARRHAVFPTNLNRKGRVNSVEFVDKPGGSSPEFVRIDITERPFQTIFSVESAGLQKIQYVSGVDTSDPETIALLRQEAWAFAPHDISPLTLDNCFGDGGNSIRVGKVEAEWTRGNCATVQIWESGIECQPGATSPTVEIEDVANLSHDVAAGSYVIIGRAVNGKWYLLEAGKTDDGSCRATIGGELVTTWPGWDSAKTQVLGHDSTGCLKWIDTTSCP